MGEQGIAPCPHLVCRMITGNRQHPLQPTGCNSWRLVGAQKERDSTTSGAPIAIWKSWAAWPMRRSGGSSPIAAFIERDRNGSSWPALRPDASFNPPISSVSTCCSRASSAPQMKALGWPPPRGLTILPAISASRGRRSIRARSLRGVEPLIAGFEQQPGEIASGLIAPERIQRAPVSRADPFQHIGGRAGEEPFRSGSAWSRRDRGRGEAPAPMSADRAQRFGCADTGKVQAPDLRCLSPDLG